MPDYYDGDEATREYDPVLFRRILSYAGRYKGLLLLTALSLIVSTAGELYVPLLIRRVLDEAVFSSYREVPAAAGKERGARVLETAAGARRFVPRTAAEPRSGGGEWYLFSVRTDGAAYSLALSRPDLFIVSSPRADAAVRLDDLSRLPIAERRLVRSADYARIRAAVVVFLLVLALVLVATFVQTYAASLVGQKAMTDIRLAVFSHTCSQSQAFLLRHPVGRLVTRMTGDVETINEFFTSVSVSFLKDVAVMAGVLVALFSLSPRLALVAVCTLPPVFAVTAVSRVKARNAFRRQRTALSRVNSYLAERLAGVHVVQLFRREKASGEEFAQRDRELLEANLGEMYVFASFRPLIDFLSALTTAAVIGAGAYFFLGSTISLGVLIAFINLTAMFYAPVQDISEKYTLLQSAMAGAERIFKLLDTEEKIPDRQKPAAVPPIAGRIEFRSVRFSYKPGEEILKGLSFTVEPGETAAIVGYTGAGKTTVTNLLARLWDVSGGDILIDGAPIRELPLSALRSSVLPVMQEVFLFSGTVAENIRLGAELSDREVEEAAEAVHADGFISRLPEGYRTILSEGATNISSGQRQLISFARVVAHDPRIVILDEATSSIDTETERLIQLGLARVLKNRTALVIAHRLSTIRHADRILVLSGGRLVEEGVHDELLARGGAYAKLYKLQYERSGP